MTGKKVKQNNKHMEKIEHQLSSPDLVKNILVEAHKTIAREDDALIVLLIDNWLILVKNAQPTSSNLAINSKSRAGKDHIAKNFYKILMRPELYIHFSKVTKTAFTYYKHGDNDWTWDGKQLHIEDISTDVLQSSVFKTLCSGSNKALVTVNQEAVEFNVPGKPNITITAYDIDFNQEALGRFSILHLDESEEQTRAVKVYLGKKGSGTNNLSEDGLLREALWHLSPVDVVIPFESALIDLFPNSVVMRDIYGRFLDYIKASAAGHQYQRKRDDKKRVIATYDDFLIARITLLKTYSNLNMISTTSKDERVLEYLQEKPGATKNDLKQVSGIGSYYAYQSGSLDQLEGNGLIFSEHEYHENSHQTVKKYFVEECKLQTNFPMFPDGISFPDDVKSAITSMMNNTYNSENLKTNLKTHTPGNSSGFRVLRWLFDCGKEYYNEDCKVANLSENPKTRTSLGELAFRQYFGFQKEESKDSPSSQTILDNATNKQKMEEYIQQVGGRATEKGLLAFFENKMLVKDPKECLSRLLSKSILTNYTGKNAGIAFTGSDDQ